MPKGNVKIQIMNKHDKIFTALLIVSGGILTGILTENIRSVLNPQPPEIQIDVARVKAEIEKARIRPLGARFWRVVE